MSIYYSIKLNKYQKREYLIYLNGINNNRAVKIQKHCNNLTTVCQYNTLLGKMYAKTMIYFQIVKWQAQYDEVISLI